MGGWQDTGWTLATRSNVGTSITSNDLPMKRVK